MDTLPAVEIEAPGNTDINAAIVWMHGLGANGNDFVPVVPELGLSEDYGIRFVFPHAPEIPVTINNGFVMPAWYDITALNAERSINAGQLQNSVRRIQDLVQREIDRGIDSSRIILAGFSQGGAVAYEAALSFGSPLAGIIALSTYMPTAETLKPQPVHKNDLPILVCHGQNDPVVPEALGLKAVDALRAMGFEPDYRNYPMEHAVCMPEITDIGAFIRKLLG